MGRMAKLDQVGSLHRVLFDDFELLPDKARLLHRGHRVKLQPQPCRVLAYLIARSPAIVTKEEVGEHVWEAGVHVDLDQSLNYCIRQIRRVLGDDATRPRYIETLPRQGYRFICPMETVAIPAVDGRAELNRQEQNNNPGLSQTTSRSQDPAAAGSAPEAHGAVMVHVAERVNTGGRPRLGIVVSMVLMLAALLLALQRNALLSGLTRPHVERLAVLPIENLSGDPGKAYIADGLTDELITMLAKDSSLQVISRTSVMQYKGAHRPLPEVARALGADAVLEGSFAQAGTRTHVALQLIRADNDSHLWAETYDRDVNDESVPSQAAHAIAERLNRAVLRSHAARFIAPAAHDAYLRGHYLWPTARSSESGAYFRQATEIQPDYAEAWAGLANYYGAGIAGGALDPRTSIGFEENAAERAISLAPDIALSHQAMAATYLIGRWEPENADREVLVAIRMDPNDARSYYLRGDILAALNRMPEAIEALKKSMDLDPYGIPAALAAIYLEARLYDESLAEIKFRMDAAPNDPGLLYTAKEAWRCKGNYKEAMEAWAKFYVVTGDLKSAAAMRQAYANGGARGFVLWELRRRLLQAKRQYVSPIEIASYYAQLDDKEHALALIEEGYRQHSTDFLWVPDDPAFDFLHADARYQAIVAKYRSPSVRE